jgi:hypothetical protein
LTYLADG